MAVRVKLNSAGMKALLNDPGVRAELTRRAGPVLAAAKADPHDDTGAYEAGLHIEQATTDRAVVRVVAARRLDDAVHGVLHAGADVLEA